MATVHYWKAWCTTDNKWVHGWNDTQPTKCFENISHDVDISQNVILGTVEDVYPRSSVGDKIAVHSSPKPDVYGKTTYVVWTGAGDDLTTSPDTIGGGDLMIFSMTPGTPTVTKLVKFSPEFGDVWIHEAYLKFENAGVGDYIEAYVTASPTPLQTAANLNLYIDGDFIKFTTGTPTATHGFAGTPVLLPRTFSHDGDWDYDGTDLTPNLSGTGAYKMSNIERRVHKFVNKIPCMGNCPTYFSMTSDETSYLPSGYFMEIVCHNVSNTTWTASVIMEIYREKTYEP